MMVQELQVCLSLPVLHFAFLCNNIIYLHPAPYPKKKKKTIFATPHCFFMNEEIGRGKYYLV